jgi:hypothetical protein
MRAGTAPGDRGGGKERSAGPMAFLLRMAGAMGPAVLPAFAVAQGGPTLDLQLNKVAEVNGACRTTFVADNGLGQDIDKLSLDVVVFGPNGEVDQRLLPDLGRMPKGKARVVEFDLPKTSCSKLSRVLLNQVQECSTGGKPVAGCSAHLDTSSKVAKLPFDL